jgi:succinoglycan biosynthesis protein ExoM
MPEIVVCVCTRRRPHLLARTLAALGRMEFGDLLAPASVGLVVVDNCPDGRARAACERVTPGLPVPLRFADEPAEGLSLARNRAVAEALAWGARLIAFLDDDDEPRPDWLRHLVEAQERTGAELVFGTWALSPELRLPPHLARLRYFQPVRLDNVNAFGLPGWAGTYNVLLGRHVLEVLGSRGPVFRPDFVAAGGEDTDLFVRARRAGFAHAIAPASVVTRTWEPHRLTLGGVLRRAFMHGGSRIHVARAHLTPDELRRLARSSWRKLAKAALTLPAAPLRAEGATPALIRVARGLGELYAWRGRSCAYYAPAGRETSVAAPAAGVVEGR